MGAYNIVGASSLVAGQPEDVSQVLANFQAIQTVLNGGIDATNIAAGKVLDLSKLTQNSAVAGDLPVWDGATSTWKPASQLATRVGLPVGMGADIATANTITVTNQIHRLTGGTTVKTINGGVQGAQVTLITTNSAVPFDASGNIGMIVGGFLIPGGAAITLTWDATSSLWRPTSVTADAVGTAPATTLPSSPQDGQLTILTDSTGSPTYHWLMRYLAATGKWIFIGGNPAKTTGGGITIGSTGAYIVCSNTFTCTYAGTYRAWSNFSNYTQGVNMLSVCDFSMAINGTVGGLTASQYMGNHADLKTGYLADRYAVTAGQTLGLKVNQNAGTIGGTAGGTFWVQPEAIA
jgi:hypothetical protein